MIFQIVMGQEVVVIYLKELLITSFQTLTGNLIKGNL